MKPRTAIGMTLTLTGVVALTWALWHVIDIGECGGDGAPPCPPGSGKYFAGMAYGITAPIIGGIMAKKPMMQFVYGIPLIGVMFITKAIVDRAPEDRLGLYIGGGIALGVTVLGGAAIGRMIKKQATAAKLVQTGSKAKGVVVGVRDTGVLINNNPRVEITFRLEPLDGSSPWEASKTVTVSKTAIPRNGDAFPVWYEPMAKEPWAVGMFTGEEEPDPAMLAEFGIAPPGDDPDVDDTVESLERLTALYERGVLDDSEFADQKRRILEASDDTF